MPLRIFEILKKSITDKEQVTISYAGAFVVPAYWLNSAIGALYGIFSKEEIKEYLKVAHAKEVDLETLKRVTDNAKRYFEEKP